MEQVLYFKSNRKVSLFHIFFSTFINIRSQRCSQGRSSCSQVLCQDLEIPSQWGTPGGAHILITSLRPCRPTDPIAGLSRHL